ncbi:DNA adenine methylase [Micromonospora craterilacus]|uniref:Site-specific DNA-methyltransferase (adenine-specific) n=1 Tax=Micromonospora craterilacus TaxID=1655439 RepID=A0A2W2DHY0_9ACTN|nr:DNA adenine methylase [Micromonospora craterilacus]PZG11526.1 DNA adenine methylase [Micromonospora craterilacus]
MATQMTHRTPRQAASGFDAPCGTLFTMTPVPIAPRRLPSLDAVPHAIPYQGSKRQLAHGIVPLLPSDTERLIEPFAGSAAVSIAAAHLAIPDSVVISDINEPLMDLWQRILADSSALADDYERLWQAQLSDPRRYYEEIRAKFNATHEPHFLLYLLARCVKAAVRYNRLGEFNQGADNRRFGAKPATMRARLEATATALAGAAALTRDYTEALEGADAKDVVYMDPPYEGVSNTRDHRYMAGLSRESFVASLSNAIDRDVSFILSYDGSTGTKSYGTPLTDSLNLAHLHLYAGKSSQATLNGETAHTVESLYLSPALVSRLGGVEEAISRLLPVETQPALL